ncbi:MAG: TlpA family protein disulfide reductase [Planctomycetota bacterium]
MNISLGDVHVCSAAAELLKYTKPNGRPLVVNHFATWCEPCMSELPYLAAAAHKYKDRIDFVGISWERFTDNGEPREVAKNIESVILQYNVPFRVALAPPKPEELFETLALDAQVIPQTYIYNSTGAQVFSYCGELEHGEPQRAFEAALESALLESKR